MIKDKNYSEPVYYAAISKDKENIMESSSGGVFFELCKSIISKGGKVYGAVQSDKIKIEHRAAQTLEEASNFRKSKYLRSNMGNCYSQILEDLQQGRIVLFSGVGCQISGLYSYLKKEFKNLYTCEVVCHGVPLEKAMDKYIKEKESEVHDEIKQIIYRDKRKGWKKNSICEKYVSGKEEVVLSEEHPVHSLYLRGINMERGCGSCKYQRLPRIADITLADFWKYQGYLKNEGEDIGISLIGINSQKGEILLNETKKSIRLDISDKETVLKSCRHMSQPPYLHPSQRAFQSLIAEQDFMTLYKLFVSLEEIRVSEECQILSQPNEEKIIDIFWEDTQEVIYIVNEAKVIEGIITFGSFISNYSKSQEWVNRNFVKIVWSFDCVERIQKIFEDNKKINRLPVVDNKGRFLFEVRRTAGANGKKDARKMLLPFSIMLHRKIKCLYVKRPDLLIDFPYTESQKRRIKHSVSFPVMQENMEQYCEDLQEIYESKFSEDYVNGLCKIPKIAKLGNSYRHLDALSKYVNVIGGMRVTTNQPEDYLSTIHLYGRCGVFGYAVEDEETLPSKLQYIINKDNKKIRVVNHGLWGADNEKIINNLLEDLKDKKIEENDIVILYMDYLPIIEELKALFVENLDTTIPFHDFIRNHGNFFDKPGHMTAEGYQFLAMYLYQYMCENDYLSEKKYVKKCNLINDNVKSLPNELAEYLVKIKEKLPENIIENSTIGSIVMNCNPFTKGHRYLVERALQDVDVLIIFVVEEDKSYFSFEDRFNMVKSGVADLENVFVFPSGNYMISSLTFPEYFTKEQQQNVSISPADDVLLFAQYIAPYLNISIRFVGTEPTDKVTEQYNQTLKSILPMYGISLSEIKRMKVRDRSVSASTVRNLIKNNELDNLKELLPRTTWEYLVQRGMLGVD